MEPRAEIVDLDAVAKAGQSLLEYKILGALVLMAIYGLYKFIPWLIRQLEEKNKIVEELHKQYGDKIERMQKEHSESMQLVLSQVKTVVENNTQAVFEFRAELAEMRSDLDRVVPRAWNGQERRKTENGG